MEPTRVKRILLFLVIWCVLPVQLQRGLCDVNEDSPMNGLRKEGLRLDAVMVLDNSGSMRKNDPRFLARDVVADFVFGLAGDSRLGMVVFDNRPELVQPLVEMNDLETKNGFLKGLDRLNYNGPFSDSPAAIERAIYELKTRGRDDAARIIVLMTDGIVDTGESARDLQREKWLTEGLALAGKRAGIRIFGIAFGNSADFSVIQTLSLRTKGEYFRVFDTRDIAMVFSRIAETIIGEGAEQAEPAPSSAIQPVRNAPALREAKPVPPVQETEGTEARKSFDLQGAGVLVSLILAGTVLILAALIVLMYYRQRETEPVQPKETAVEPPGPSRALPSIPQALLVDVGNVTNRKTMILEREVTSIGRGENNDVSIPQKTVSGYHATIEYRNGIFYLEDQRSRNKTYLNGDMVAPFTPQRLKSGDEITFTASRFVFLIAYQTPSGETVVVGEN